MTEIIQNLHRFSSYVSFINLSFNQYLLLAEESILVHTGNQEQATAILPELNQILGNRTLSYVFVSHFESDECGGLRTILQEYPAAQTLCSGVTARQLSGFGITQQVLVKQPGEHHATKDYDLEFIAYPSEAHMWEGLLAFETKTGTLFSSDLFLRFGEIPESLLEIHWSDELETISPEQIPSPTSLEKTKLSLSRLPVNYVATGHGPFLKVKA